MSAAVAVMLGSCSPPQPLATLDQVSSIDDVLYAVEAELLEARAAIQALEVRVRDLERPKARSAKTTRKKQRRRPATPRRSICPLFGL